MKLMRDRLKQVKKDGVVTAMLAAVMPGADRAESMAALSLARKLAPAGRDLEKMAKLMDEVRWEGGGVLLGGG